MASETDSLLFVNSTSPKAASILVSRMSFSNFYINPFPDLTIRVLFISYDYSSCLTRTP